MIIQLEQNHNTDLMSTCDFYFTPNFNLGLVQLPSAFASTDFSFNIGQANVNSKNWRDIIENFPNNCTDFILNDSKRHKSFMKSKCKTIKH